MGAALRLSIAVNLLLGGTVAALLWWGPPAARPGQPPALRTAPPTSGSAAAATQLKSAGGRLTPAAIAELEGMGVSRELLMNVFLEDFARRWDKRVLALQQKYAPKLVPRHELLELGRLSDAEKARELQETFGEAGYEAWDKEQTLRVLNRARKPGDDLPMSPDEADQAYRLQKAFNDKARDLEQAMEDGVADRADAGALEEQAQKQLDAQLESLLGKQRFDELKGNTDPTTQAYQSFGALNPTPDQASAAAQAEADYRAKSEALGAQLGASPADAASLATQLQALMDARDSSLRQIFGPDAYNSLQQQNDPTYQTLQQFAGAWNLNDSDVQQVYDSVHAFQQQADNLRAAAQMSEQAGQHVDWNAVNASINQALQQTESGLQATLGPDRLQRLMQNGVLTLH